MNRDEENIQSEVLNEISSSLDEDKLKKITIRIIELERENVKTKEFNSNEMKNKIRKIIEEEVGCY